MLIRKQDLCVLLFYCLGYSRIRNLMLRLQRKPVVRFLTFHDLPAEAIECFKANLFFLKRCTNVVSLDDYISGRLSSDKINTVITFDDGFKGWVLVAVPVLKELKLPAIFFVSSGFVGRSKEDEAAFIRSKLLIEEMPHRRITGSLNADDVKGIVDEGFTVGGHTVNHCNLAELRDNTQLRYEIAEDKLTLERLTGTKIDYFSYPFGAYHNPEINITEVLKASGYRGAVTTISGFNSVETNPFLLRREITYASMPGPVFRARAYGNYDAVRFLKQCVPMALQR
jgi:peptidoglycan/xylan/chitin deacetylase (PgdA/CDA1 family)